jgi:hypothetical protein
MDKIEGNDWAAVMGPHRPKWRQWSRNNRFAEIRLSDRAKITLVELFSLEDIHLVHNRPNTHNVRRSCSPSVCARQRQDRSRHAEEWYFFVFTCYEKKKKKKLTRSGKNWNTPKKAFRPTAGLKSYEKRLQDRNNLAAMKEREKEMKDEKEAERQVCPSIRR